MHTKQLTHSLILFLGLVLYILFINTAFVVWLQLNGIHLNLVSQIIFRQLLSFFVPFCAYKLSQKNMLENIVNLRAMTGKQTLLVTAVTMTALPIGMFVSGVTSLFFDNAAAQLVMPAIGHYELIWLLIAMAVTPAVMEELVFRGALHHALAGLPVSVIALVSGLLFGIVHFNLQQFSYAFLLGILFSLLVQYTGSIWAGIYAHLLVNGINVALIYLQASAMARGEALPESVAQLASNNLHSLFVMGGVALVALPCLQWLLRTLKSS